MNFCGLPQSQKIFEMRRAKAPEPCRATGMGGGQGWFRVSGDWGAYIDLGCYTPQGRKSMLLHGREATGKVAEVCFHGSHPFVGPSLGPTGSQTI